MNEPLSNFVRRFYWIIPALLSFCFAFHDQSFWIDECCTALCSVRQTVQECWVQICQIGGSDAQIAFYYILLHFWHLLTGADNEWSLRLFNLLWVLLAAFFFRKYPKALILLLISPFFIYYSEELRPYILQIAASCGVSVFLFRATQSGELKVHALFASLFFLCLCSLSGVVWSLGFLLGLLVLLRNDIKQNLRKYGIAFLTWLFPFLLLGGYYVFTLLIGARAVSLKSNGLLNFAASFYELLGCAGLGPSRQVLRECYNFHDLLTQSTALLPGLIGGAIALLCLYWGIRYWKQQHAAFLPALALSLLFSIAVFIYASFAMDFRFSGRHCAPLLPVLCLLWSGMLRHKHGLQTRLTDTAYRHGLQTRLTDTAYRHGLQTRLTDTAYD